MKSGRYVAVAAAACMGWVQGACAQAEWKLATGYGAGSFQTENIRRFAQDVQTATAARVRIAVHPNNMLVPMAGIRQEVASGAIEAGEVILSSLAAQMPLAEADSVPFIVGSYADARRLWKYQRPLIEREFARNGLVVLYAVPWPAQGLYARQPVRSTRDLRGLNMRTYNAATERIAELVGARPVQVAMTEVGQALAAGRFETMVTSSVTGAENRVSAHLKYFYAIYAWMPKNIVFLNRRAFDALAPADRDVVLKAAEAAEARGWAMSEDADRQALAQLAKEGMTVEPAPLELRQELRRYGERFSLEWLRKVPQEANLLFVPYFTGYQAASSAAAR
ncbi:TRAP transporter substrate-binding protein [Schlegelella sp. S2-27]|uniref:TRAP transporter substrate-binding protein n=1 Tax=Caldimonas mangrovi TaxID=2944811 RepID=A0ABT0YV81_9BURK|nr:TRAP transporter substrate-binding protein [Caldimonas mangrovi]MCM5682655.1 TRAP transporter substrate-binding protein [Caldimonas mangrovi]